MTAITDESFAEMSSRIYLDYQRASALADDLERTGSSISSLSGSRVADDLQSARAAWKGSSADMFLEKGQVLCRRLSASGQELCKIASAIRETARLIFETEQENLEIARQRTYQ